MPIGNRTGMHSLLGAAITADPITADELKRRGTDAEIEGRAIEIVYRLGFPRPHPASLGDVLGEPCVPVPVDWLADMIGRSGSNVSPEMVELRASLIRLLAEQERFVATYTATEPPPERKEHPMQVREFQIIAAAGYAAQQAANIVDEPRSASWDELTDLEQSEIAERAMKVARQDVEASEFDAVFVATVNGILGFNHGQGGLALERIADLGNTMIDLGLVVFEKAEGDIVEDAKELLGELAKLRGEGGDQAEEGPKPPTTPYPHTAPSPWSTEQLRLNALNLATAAGGDLDLAAQIAEWIEAQTNREIAVSAMHFAISAQPKDAPTNCIEAADRYYNFLIASPTAPTVQ